MGLVRVVRMGLPNCFIVRGQISVILRCLVLPLASAKSSLARRPSAAMVFPPGMFRIVNRITFFPYKIIWTVLFDYSIENRLATEDSMSKVHLAMSLSNIQGMTHAKGVRTTVPVGGH